MKKLITIMLLGITLWISACAANDNSTVEVTNANVDALSTADTGEDEVAKVEEENINASDESVKVEGDNDYTVNDIQVDENGLIYNIDLDLNYAGKLTVEPNEYYAIKNVIEGYEQGDNGLYDLTKPIISEERELVGSTNGITFYQNGNKIGETLLSSESYNINKEDCKIENDMSNAGSIDYSIMSQKDDLYVLSGPGFSFSVNPNTDEIALFHIDFNFKSRLVGLEKPDVDNSKVFYYLDGSYIGWRRFENIISVDEDGNIQLIELNQDDLVKLIATPGEIYKSKNEIVGYETNNDGTEDFSRPIWSEEKDLVAKSNYIEFYVNDNKIGQTIESDEAYNIDEDMLIVETDLNNTGTIDYDTYKKEGNICVIEGEGYLFRVDSNTDEIISIHIDGTFKERFVGIEKHEISKNSNVVYYYINGSYVGWRSYNAF